MSEEKKNNPYFDLIYGYIGKDDNSRNNANLVYSLPTLNSIMSGAISKDFWFDQVYQDYKGVSSRDLYDEGWIYFHNMSIIGPYCAGFSSKDIATLGLNSTADNNISTRPPKYYRSLLDLCANFIAVISQEIHGACAMNDLTAIVASYLWYQENEKGKPVDHHDLVNAYESFIYAVNTPFRAGNSPFTNITMNFEWDPHLKEDYVVIGGQVASVKYKEIPTRYLNLSNKAFIDAMKKGDAKGKPFTFPLITVNIYDEFDYENEIFNYLLENMDSWGGCYFENYRTKPFLEEKWRSLNKYIEPRDPSSQKSFCCRFRVDFNDILRASGGTSFRSNSGVGGIGVFNINLHRIMFTSLDSNGNWNKEKFYERLDFILEAAECFAQRRRKFIEAHKELYPYFFFYNKSLATFFNVLSVVGAEEGIVNFGYKDGLKDPQGRKIAHEIATHIVDKINEMMIRDKAPVSLEYAPSENGAPTMAKKDRAFIQNIRNGGKSIVFPNDSFEYTNDLYLQGDGNDVFLTSGFQPPYNEKNIGAQIQISAEFQSYATGGSVQHFFLGEKLPIEIKKRLVQKTFETPVLYMTLTPTLSTCGDCGEQMVGEHLLCPHCSSANVMVASRVIGYLRPIAGKNLNKDSGRLDGEENYWQDSRRKDWASRKQTISDDIDMLMQD
ncbi:MAG: anaerobic ribonucleoside-triphosphate reductase [Candidatus Absconditabacteria bacterium]